MRNFKALFLRAVRTTAPENTLPLSATTTHPGQALAVRGVAEPRGVVLDRAQQRRRVQHGAPQAGPEVVDERVVVRHLVLVFLFLFWWGGVVWWLLLFMGRACACVCVCV